MRTALLTFAVTVARAISAQAQTSYTYTYNGPTFTNGTDHVAVSFSTAAPLAASTSYLDPASASVTASSVSVVGPAGPLATFEAPTRVIASQRRKTVNSKPPINRSPFLVGMEPWRGSRIVRPQA